MEKSTIEAVHKVQLGMTKQIHQRCKEEGLRYTVISGSLLGAIRHKGFIPWDDDVDIGLLREDYERLLESLKKKPLEGCLLQEYSTDPHYYQPFAKLIRENTVCIEEFSKNCKARNGVFIDIFPFDLIKRPGQRATKLLRSVLRIIMFAIWHKEDCHMERKGMKKAVNGIAAVVSLLPKSFLVWLQRSLAVRENKDWKYAASLYSSHYETDRLYFEVSDFDELIEAPFEDIVVNIPRNWDENLRRQYHDYMQLPPEDKRSVGHGIYIINDVSVE